MRLAQMARAVNAHCPGEGYAGARAEVSSDELKKRITIERGGAPGFMGSTIHA
jgi:hypothetical protein